MTEEKIDLKRLDELITEVYIEAKNGLNGPSLEHFNNNHDLYRDQVIKSGSNKLKSMYSVIIEYNNEV